MKTVVAGGAGFIGANLVRRLLKAGRDVRAVDNVTRRHKENLDGLDVEIVHADLRDYNQALRAVTDADVVYHLAARVGSVEYLHGTRLAELETLQDNLSIDVNVLRACREAFVNKVVYASSVSVYPIDRQATHGARFAEDDVYPINPEGGYGWAKLVGELQLDLMENCKSGIARIFNAYGEYCEYGATAQVVPSLIRKAILFPHERFTIWGDGDQTRCLLYIGDCVDALLKLEKRASYRPLKVNIGSEDEITIRKLAELIIQISGKNIEPKLDVGMPVGPVSRAPDVSKAKEVLSWTPRVSLQEGLRRTYDFVARTMRRQQLQQLVGPRN